jgi:4-amino-4-deoxy-L-arabinose transferase-like glycosyltransferase
MRSKKIYFIIIGIALVSFFLVHSAARTKSLTWDEPSFIVSGYSYLDNKEFKLSPDNPPLMLVLSALPLKFLDLLPPDYSHEDYRSNSRVQFSNLFFENNISKFDEMTILSRLPVHLLFALLVIMTGLFVNIIAGSIPAIIAAVLVGFSPTLLAHGQLATTDFGCTVFMFISVYTFYLAIRAENNKRWVICGVVTGIAFLSKFTALLLVPIFIIFALYEIIFNKKSTNILFRGIIILVFFILLVLCLGYKFTPWLYVSGISQIYVRNNPDSYYYLFGNILDRAVWYYYFAAFIAKTPVSTLLLLTITTYVSVRNKLDRDIIIYFLVPAGVIMFVCTFDTHNLGIRRVLPMYPFLFSFISCTYNHINSEFFKKTIFSIFLAWNIIATIIAYPHYISFFNIVVGGSSNGPNLLEDSNLDWGQDLPALVEWQKNNYSDEPINIAYFGTINPRLYGLTFRQISEEELLNPRNGIYAISAHYLIYTRKAAFLTNEKIDWLELYEPIGHAGNSIYIYQFNDKTSN